MSNEKQYRDDVVKLVERIQSNTLTPNRGYELDRDECHNEIMQSRIPAAEFVRFVAAIFKQLNPKGHGLDVILKDTAEALSALALCKIMTQITLVKSSAGVYIFAEGYDLSTGANEVENLTTVSVVTPPDFEELEWSGEIDCFGYRRVLVHMMSVIQVTDKGKRDTYKRTDEVIQHDADNARIRLFPKSDEVHKNKVIDNYLESVMTGDQSFVVRVSHCIDVLIMSEAGEWDYFGPEIRFDQ